MRRTALALIVLCAACAEQRPGPVVDAVTPSIVSNSAAAELSIEGRNFHDFVLPRLDDDEPPVIDRTWDVRIGDTPGIDARRESDERLLFTMPAGIAPGVYDVTATAPDGQSDTLVDGLTVVDGPVALVLAIETAGDGTGVPVTPPSLGIGETIELFAVVRNGGVFVRGADAAWSTDSIGTVSARPGPSTLFEALAAGTGLVTASDSTVGTASLQVNVVGDVVTSIRIDDAPGGAGSEVGDLSLGVGGSLTLHAVELDELGAFVADASVTWTVTGGIGTLAAGPATSTNLVLTASGTGRVSASSALGSDETGDLSVATTVTLISDDPGDGSRRASVFGYGERLVVGPSDDGTTTRLMNPDGSVSIRQDLSFFGDTTGLDTSRNTSPSPYPSLGSAGCAADTPACGPDNESGRGMFGSGTIGGVDWMIAVGARDLELDYIYMTPNAAALEFRYVDLTDYLGGRTERMTAMHVFRDSLYMGFSDNGGQRPFFVRLDTTPDTPPGLETTPLDAVNLRAASFPNFVPADRAMLDTIWDFGDRIYTANAGAWVRATREMPRPGDTNPGDWVEITPSADAFDSKDSVLTVDFRELESSDRAVPFMATFQGRLYVARNTTGGPQLWACDPSVTGSPTDCDADDFALVAPNVSGDAELTTFDNLNNTSISLLTATASYLYIGYDNAADGVVVFRTASAAPTIQADFEGASGCSALDHPATCEGLGGNGFGVSTNQIIFDGRAITFATGEAVFLTTGDGTAPVKVYRIAP